MLVYPDYCRKDVLLTLLTFVTVINESLIDVQLLGVFQDILTTGNEIATVIAHLIKCKIWQKTLKKTRTQVCFTHFDPNIQRKTHVHNVYC